jgi:hypothetical protein
MSKPPRGSEPVDPCVTHTSIRPPETVGQVGQQPKNLDVAWRIAARHVSGRRRAAAPDVGQQNREDTPLRASDFEENRAMTPGPGARSSTRRE